MKQITYKDLRPWLKAGMLIAWATGALWVLAFILSIIRVF